MIILWKRVSTALVFGIMAFAIFGPLLNLLFWAFAERWYFPYKYRSNMALNIGNLCSIQEEGPWNHWGPASQSPLLPLLPAF